MEDNTPPIQLVLDPLLDFRKSVHPAVYRTTQRYAVGGYGGGGYDPSTQKGRAANCHYAINEAIEQALFCLNRPFEWAKTSMLGVNPEAGRMWNAFYNRRTLQFFFNDDNINHRRCYTSAAAKIVFHESGHAILDGIRPDLFNLANFEIWSVHEAFGDLMAFLATMRNSELHYTNDRRLWSGIGIEFGQGIFSTRDEIYRPLRDLSVRFDWAPPSTLPRVRNDAILVAEPHSFSRVFSSAVYALFLRIMEKETVKETADPVGKAAEVVGRYLLIGISLSAVNEFYMDSVARAMMYVDWREGYPYQDLMVETFSNQNVLRPKNGISAQSNEPKLTHQKISKMCLAEEGISAQSVNPLHQLNVQIGEDENSDRKKIKEDVSLCLDYLHRNDYVDQPKSPFVTWKGNLIRRHFACNFCGTN